MIIAYNDIIADIKLQLSSKLIAFPLIGVAAAFDVIEQTLRLGASIN